MSMKNLTYSLLMISLFTFSACDNDDNPTVVAVDPDPVSENINVTGMLTGVNNWTSDNIYVLNQKVVVDAGATLNIECGTIIKGSAGTGSLASALVVARGGTLNANGTADCPIIMTSESDNIEVGQTAGTNLGINDRGLWGGLIVLGYAPSSFSGDVSEVQIEGIPANDTFGLYGGNDASDNSGSITYVSIRHGGALIGEDNEINGLTLGGVGNGTVIDNIEVVANTDDGIEFFGGTVNASNLLVWGQGDDGLDIDQAYSGTIDNAVVVLGDVSDHALEIDGPEGSLNGQFELRNITIIGSQVTEDGEYADYRSNAMGYTTNLYAVNFKASSDIEIDNDGVANNYNSGLLSFGTFEIVVPEGATLESIFNNRSENVTVDGFGSIASSIAADENTVGANTANLAWSYSNTAAALGW